MEITNKNFEQLLPHILESIRKADFIALDCEFTGLGTAVKENRLDVMDTMQERYTKISNVAQNFLPIQIGISTFEYSPVGGHYIANPFNFYVFPRTGNKIFGLDRHFSSQVSSLEFLNSCNFNWNKWIESGIPFITSADQAKIEEKLNLLAELDGPLSKGDPMYEFAEEVKLKTTDFMQNSIHKELFLDAPSSYHKRIIHHTVQREFNGFVGAQSRRTTVQLVKLTVEERQTNLENSKSQILKKELLELVGFRRVIDAISSVSVPVVGHNMFLDLCFLYQNFYGPLPKDFEDFKNGLSKHMPEIFDTKYIAHLCPKIIPAGGYLNTALQDLYNLLNGNNEFPRIGRECEDVDIENFHEAGFDAYATGTCFLRSICKENGIGKKQRLDIKKLCEKYKNRLYIMQSLFPCITITGPNEVADFSSVFKVTKFPITWKTGDIQQNLKDLGQFNVKWIDDNSCLILLKDKKFIPIAQELCQRKPKKTRKFILTAFFDQKDLKESTAEENTRKRKREEDNDVPGEVSKKKKGCIIQ